jgi:hypothetical protein
MKSSDMRLSLHLFIGIYHIPAKECNGHGCGIQISVQLGVLISSNLFKQNCIPLNINNIKIRRYRPTLRQIRGNI